MKYITYIIYSSTIKKYYTGSSSQDINQRLYKHNINHRGFTGRAKDWKVVYLKIFHTVSESRTLERSIKKCGAERYLARITHDA